MDLHPSMEVSYYDVPQLYTYGMMCTTSAPSGNVRFPQAKHVQHDVRAARGRHLGCSQLPPLQVFYDFPELYMYGMMCALSAAGIWVALATYLELAVSTTHSIIGAIMGFALVWQVCVSPGHTLPFHALPTSPGKCFYL